MIVKVLRCSVRAVTVLFIMSIYCINTEHRVDWVILVVLLTGIITGFYCIFQYLGLDPILMHGITMGKYFKKGYLHVVGFIDNPNTLSSFLILIPPIAMADFLRKKLLSQRIVPALGLVFSLIGLFLASSMSGILILSNSTPLFLNNSCNFIRRLYPLYLIPILQYATCYFSKERRSYHSYVNGVMR